VKRIDTDLPEVCLIEPKVFGDSRGFFLETWREDRFADLGITARFVQDNWSRSSRGVLRGLHWQIGRPQAKLVRVLTGAVYDVAVDIRRGSPTFSRWTGQVLSDDNKRAMFIPEGFAHGFLVLSETCDFVYCCSDYYSPAEERGIIWNDPAIGIAWPLSDMVPTLSEKDRRYPTLMGALETDLPR
jgi:dTDP-4-dehydrorhamnose 3,5-epimerase